MKPCLFLLACGLCVLFVCASSCEPNFADNCPTCPNNTSCIDGDCGCNEDQHDMGSWCLAKGENLFVAASLDCYCLDVVGLNLISKVPETEPGNYPKSKYSIYQRAGVYNGALDSYAYYELPDGDSIVAYNIIGAGFSGFETCLIGDTMRCEVDFFGKFHGPDTIETKVRFTRCVDTSGVYNNHQEFKHLTFVRKK